MAARSAGGNNHLLESEERAFDGVQCAGEKNVVLQMLIESPGNRLGLFIDLPAHDVGEAVGREV